MRTDSVTFWSWTASIGLHLIILTMFAVWRLSEANQALAAKPVPTAAVVSVADLANAAPITPKPKVRKVRNAYAARFAANSRTDSAVTDIFAAEPTDSQPEPIIVRPADSSAGITAAAAALPARNIEFFGSSTYERKICYVVDCSGSMQGVFGQVQRKLKDSIAALRPNQYFYVIFFGGQKLFESGQGLLIRATDKAKAAACDFIDSIRPAGATNAADALARALQIQDEEGRRPPVLYFLTDGFELDPLRADAFSQTVIQMIKTGAPSIKINTIGFWPHAADKVMLESIASSTGGQAIFVTEDIR